MKAMVYHAANDIRLEEKPKPQIIDPTDAVVRIVKTTICGTDLGIWKGKNPEVADGPQSLIAEQVEMGVAVRMAVLEALAEHLPNH